MRHLVELIEKYYSNLILCFKKVNFKSHYLDKVDEIKREKDKDKMYRCN